MKKTLQYILTIVLAAVLLFAGICIYGAWNYTCRCVKITPKTDISVIELEKEYHIEDFFLIEREKSEHRRIVDICWEDGSKDNISVDGDGNFTVTEGSGKLIITLSDRNQNSPEEARESITVTVGV